LKLHRLRVHSHTVPAISSQPVGAAPRGKRPAAAGVLIVLSLVLAWCVPAGPVQGWRRSGSGLGVIAGAAAAQSPAARTTGATGTASPPRAPFSHSASDGSMISQSRPIIPFFRQRSVSQRVKASASYQVMPTTGWLGRPLGRTYSYGRERGSPDQSVIAPSFQRPAAAASGQKAS